MPDILWADDAYKNGVLTYTKADGVMAVAVYAFLLLVYYAMGVVYVQMQLYLGVYVNLSLIVLCVILVLARRQSLASIGFTLRNIKKSLLCGVVVGTVLTLVMNVLPNALAGAQVIPIGRALYNIFYYFIVISLSEEVVFRGYIQTRMYGLIKRDIPAVAVTGLMFYAMHFAFQAPVSGMVFSLGNMAVIVTLHVIMNFVYRKYNSIAGPTVLHGLLDWGGNLLR